MATEGPYVYDESFKAGADLSAKQFFAIKSSGTADVASLVAAASDIPIGILQNKPTANGAANVRMAGISKAVQAAGTIVPGNYVGADSNGRIVKLTPAASGSVESPGIGLALDPGTAAGTVIRVFVIPGFRVITA
jgi:hypothetical protein